MGHLFVVNNPQQFPHMLYFPSILRYIVMGQKDIVPLPLTLPQTPWYSLFISLENYLIQTSVFLFIL